MTEDIAQVPRFGSCRSATPDGSTHEMQWTEWGREDHPHVVVCAHGLTRNGRDFDFLAKRLAKSCRVICPDYPGRGQSPNLTDPQYYAIEQYAKDSQAMVSTLKYEQLDWVGTSMGGLIGMTLVASLTNPITKMILNDVGAFIPRQSMIDLADDLSIHPHFESMEEAYDYFREAYAGFGRLDDHHYIHMAEHGVWPSPDGPGYVLARDPAIIDQFAALPSADIDLWWIWEMIKIPVLIIRGEESGLLLPETVRKMQELHSGAAAVEFSACGHAPSLMVDDQIEAVAHWLGL
ncbi:MAG: alpha/beta hydrolase [Gammaproteobacteria bacterium]|nr:alpha/beta hydrolase [Gammaproteobacteria bacterium]MYJ52989.1 alpha/beta hydrolase [Gammaproteobacteria bacterium]